MQQLLAMRRFKRNLRESHIGADTIDIQIIRTHYQHSAKKSEINN